MFLLKNYFIILEVALAVSFWITPVAYATDISVDASQINNWTNGTKMPTPRAEVGVTLVDGKIYTVGGEESKTKKSKIVEAYDIDSGEWSRVAPLPIGMNHVGVSAYNGKIYAVGGTHENGYSDKLLIYDPSDDKWREGNSMPAARTALTVNFIHGKLYAVGGVDDVHNVVNTNLMYDPITNNWTERAPMPTARHHLTSSVVDGKLYAIGGRLLGNGIPGPVNEGLSNFNDNEMYDPVKNTWTVLEQMPTKRSGMASASIGTNIYVFGGQKVNGTFENNEKFDTKKNIWTTESPLPTPRLGSGAVSTANDIYVVGGKTWYFIGGELEIYHPRKQ